jgi:hypothetical protein
MRSQDGTAADYRPLSSQPEMSLPSLPAVALGLPPGASESARWSRSSWSAREYFRLERAREVLSQEHGTDVSGLAARIGKLEWWLGDLLALVVQLAGDQQA